MEGLAFILGGGFALLAALLWLIRLELIGIRHLLSTKESSPSDVNR